MNSKGAKPQSLQFCTERFALWRLCEFYHIIKTYKATTSDKTQRQTDWTNIV